MFLLSLDTLLKIKQLLFNYLLSILVHYQDHLYVTFQNIKILVKNNLDYFK
jgi:hypothetical protein